MLTNLIRGLTSLGNGPAIGYLVGGSLIGMFFGVIPGLGGVVILSIILAFIYHLNITATLCLFLATQAGSYFSASVTSILLNTPAHPEAFAVTFDGFPMAQRGEAGRALGISATSTCLGGLIGCIVLVGFYQIINYLPEVFHPPEYVALISIALLLVGTLGTDAASKAVISAGIGLMISTIGTDPITGDFRFTFGAVGLYGGIALVALALGLFAVPQMVLVFGTATTIARQDMMGNELSGATPVELTKGFQKQVLQGVADVFRHWAALVRAALVGVVTGVVPGIGGFAANFMSYGIAQQMSRHRDQFGTGIPEGIIAPEGSSLAKEAGSMVPLVGLGIPGGVGGALFIAALTIKGVKVGYGFAVLYPSTPYEIAWIIALGGLVGTAAGLLVAPWLAKVTRVPGPALVPFIMSFAVIGPFIADVSYFAVMEVLVFAIIGLTLRRLRYSLASFAIGLVLGPTLEVNIYQTHAVFAGVSFLERPLADVLAVIGIGVMVLKTVQLRRDARRANTRVVTDDPVLAAEELRRQQLRNHPYPLLGAITTVFLAGTTVAFTLYAVVSYNLTTALMPAIGGGMAAAAAIWRLPYEIGGYVTYRRSRSTPTLAVGAELPAAVSVAAASESPRLLGIVEPVPPPAVATGNVGEIVGRPALPVVREKSWGINGQYTRECVALLWFVALLVVCYVFGFPGGVTMFCVAYGLTATRRFLSSIRGRLLFTVISAGLMWTVTYEIQNILHIVFTPVVNF